VFIKWLITKRLDTGFVNLIVVVDHTGDKDDSDDNNECRSDEDRRRATVMTVIQLQIQSTVPPNEVQ